MLNPMFLFWHSPPVSFVWLLIYQTISNSKILPDLLSVITPNSSAWAKSPRKDFNTTTEARQQKREARRQMRQELRLPRRDKKVSLSTQPSLPLNFGARLAQRDQGTEKHVQENKPYLERGSVRETLKQALERLRPFAQSRR